MARLTSEQRNKKILNALRGGKELSMKALSEATGLDKDTIATGVRALIKKGKCELCGPGNKLVRVKGAKKKEDAKPAAKSTPAKKGKKKAQEEDDDEDEDEDDEDEDDEDDEDEDSDDDSDDEDEDDDDDDDDEDEDPDDDEDDEDEDDEDSDDDDDEDDEDDDDEDEDDDEDDDDDEEEEDPKPKKKGKGKPAPKKTAKSKKGSAKKSKEFTLSFKTIDTLSTKELKGRVEEGLEIAEELHKQGHKLAAEMIMRSVAKAKKQLEKRA